MSAIPNIGRGGGGGATTIQEAWVSPQTGGDANPGSQDRPYASLQPALDAGFHVIHLGVGNAGNVTYDGVLNLQLIGVGVDYSIVGNITAKSGSTLSGNGREMVKVGQIVFAGDVGLPGDAGTGANAAEGGAASTSYVKNLSGTFALLAGGNGGVGGTGASSDSSLAGQVGGNGGTGGAGGALHVLRCDFTGAIYSLGGNGGDGGLGGAGTEHISLTGDGGNGGAGGVIVARDCAYDTTVVAGGTGGAGNSGGSNGADGVLQLRVCDDDGTFIVNSQAYTGATPANFSSGIATS